MSAFLMQGTASSHLCLNVTLLAGSVHTAPQNSVAWRGREREGERETKKEGGKEKERELERKTETDRNGDGEEERERQRQRRREREGGKEYRREGGRKMERERDRDRDTEGEREMESLVVGSKGGRRKASPLNQETSRSHSAGRTKQRDEVSFGIHLPASHVAVTPGLKAGNLASRNRFDALS